MVPMQVFLSVVSPDSFLPFVPVFSSSVSEPCPYPSCLCLPWRNLLFPLFRPLVHDHNPQRADGSSRLCLRLGVSGHPCSIELSLTSDLKRIASSGYEIFLCKSLAQASATLLSALSHHPA